MKTFLQSLEGARGVLVFGDGIEGLPCEVSSVGDDYFVVYATEYPGGPRKPSAQRTHVPAASVTYFRFSRTQS